MTDEYTARERALTLAHTHADQFTSSDAIMELAERYLAFLMPETAHPAVTNTGRLTPDALRVLQDANDTLALVDTHLRHQLHNGGIAG